MQIESAKARVGFAQRGPTWAQLGLNLGQSCAILGPTGAQVEGGPKAIQMDPKLKPCDAHGRHMQHCATWDPLATASHQVGPNGDTTWGTSLAKNEESTLLRVITTMPFQSIPCCSTNPQLQVALQDSQHCFI